MSRAYDYYIHTLLEPNDKIITGTRRRYTEVKKELVLTLPADNRTEEELERAEDEYLKRNGVN